MRKGDKRGIEQCDANGGGLGVLKDESERYALAKGDQCDANGGRLGNDEGRE